MIERLFVRAMTLVAVAFAAGGSAIAADLKIVATIKPIHSLIAGVMQGVGTPRLLIDGAGSPHTFTLKPSDAKALASADIVFRVSESLEPFTIRLAKAIPASVKLVTIEKFKGLTLYTLRQTAEFAEDASDHSHGHIHWGESRDGIDGHLWLDPANARVIVAQVADILAKAMPEHAAAFHRNADLVTARIDALNRDLNQALGPLSDRSYIVFHDAYQYLERRYGMAPVGSIAISPDIQPSVKRLSILRRAISGRNVACVFAEPQFEPKLLDTIIEGTTARRGTLDPLGVAIMAGPDQYFLMMRGLAHDLRTCLIDPA
jgi:zinc transport system substrate-binding protein